MQNDLTESVQASIRPGEMLDMTYPGETNIRKEAYPSIVNTRFVQAFTNTGAGSSQFILSPNMGISDIVLRVLTTPTPHCRLAGATASSIASPCATEALPSISGLAPRCISRTFWMPRLTRRRLPSPSSAVLRRPVWRIPRRVVALVRRRSCT